MTTGRLRAAAYLAVALLSCKQPEQKAYQPLGCGSDKDCKGERVCQEGQCVAPAKPAVILPPTKSEPVVSDQEKLRALDEKERKICEERQRRYEEQRQYDEARRKRQFEEFSAQLGDMQALEQSIDDWQKGIRVQPETPEVAKPVPETTPPLPEEKKVPAPDIAPTDVAPIETTPSDAAPPAIPGDAAGATATDIQ